MSKEEIEEIKKDREALYLRVIYLEEFIYMLKDKIDNVVNKGAN